MGFSRVDLDLDIGEFVVITGESGSGKSTLLNVISGLDTYEEGEMFVCGEDTTAYGTDDYENYRKTYIGNVFQDYNLINSYTVYQNIEAVMLISGKKRKECKERVNELIEKVGLSDYRNTKVSKLSGGQKQRVAIARALAKNAPIIVADEPTGNLDSVSAEAVMETLSAVSKDKLVIVVTHNYEQAEPYATRRITMHDGTIIEDKIINEAGTKGDPAVNQLYKSLAEAAGITTGKNKRTDKFFLISLTNPCVSCPVIVDGQIETHKNDKKNHGFGLINAKEAAANYGGELSVECGQKSSGFIFRTEILFDLKEE
ncbi:MAG: ATP-binding cassette domain-containing protein [Saccharofermentans sp.]|nr:ATP-binding cassette domain-containing protein [Saccharofermentans sp.]